MSQTANPTDRLQQPSRRAFSGCSAWRRVKIGLIALAVGGLIPFSTAAEQGPEAKAAAKQVIETLYASLLDSMKNGAEKLSAEYAASPSPRRLPSGTAPL